MHKILWVATAIIMTVAIGPTRAQDDVPPENGQTEEHITVLDQADDPIAGAVVTVYTNPPHDLPEGQSFEAEIVSSQFTDTNGSVVASVPDDPAAGDYLVIVQKPGFATSKAFLDPTATAPEGSTLTAAHRKLVIDLRRDRSGRKSRKRSLSEAPCISSNANVNYESVREYREKTKIGRAFSRTERGYVAMTYRSGGMSMLGVGVSVDDPVLSFRFARERAITSDREQPFRPLVGQGSVTWRSLVKHTDWRITETTKRCTRSPRIHTYREIRPEVFLGGDESSFGQETGTAPKRANCSGRVWPNRPLMIDRSEAETMDAATRVGDLVTLSARSGYSEKISVTAGAKSGSSKPVLVCGTRGEPTNPGRVVVVNP